MIIYNNIPFYYKNCLSHIFQEEDYFSWLTDA